MEKFKKEGKFKTRSRDERDTRPFKRGSDERDTRPPFKRGSDERGARPFKRGSDERDTRPPFKRGRERDTRSLERGSDERDTRSFKRGRDERGARSVRRFEGVYDFDGRIATKNSTPGFRVYDEQLIKRDDMEFRLWDPFRSKLGAAVMKGLQNFPINHKSRVLYLGASSGTTASHVADIAEAVYCVEFSKRMMRELLPVTLKKKNMIPILGDAKRPEEYLHNISNVDVIFQDVAQRNQAEILIKNANIFSPRYAILSIKSRSISASKTPKQVFREEIDKLKEKFDVLEIIDLRPYEKDHVLVNLKVK